MLFLIQYKRHLLIFVCIWKAGLAILRRWKYSKNLVYRLFFVLFRHGFVSRSRYILINYQTKKYEMKLCKLCQINSQYWVCEPFHWNGTKNSSISLKWNSNKQFHFTEIELLKKYSISVKWNSKLSSFQWNGTLLVQKIKFKWFIDNNVVW